ncbi:MAG: hypothetical protein U1E53_17490 [Dongiaceae bacterium]
MADLVIAGRVEAITPLQGGGHAARWRVTVAVERVIEGAFAGRRFEFAVHSPTKSGLRLGGTYVIRATQTDAGYVVDPAQWLPGR